MPLADELLGVDAVLALTDVLEAATPGTTADRVRATTTTIPDLALRDRAHLVKDALLADVPGTLDDLGAVVRRCLEDDRLSGWMVWPVTEAVSARALDDGSDAALDAALALQAALTGRLTAEFAVRPLLSRDLDRSLAAALRWTTSDDEHVRRLASEGTRRYLPWGAQVAGLMADPTVTLPILDALYRDESEYVRRSVANHLNDLSRKNPEVTVETARRWLATPAHAGSDTEADTAAGSAGAGPESTTLPLVRHALRTLVKRGDADALALLGFAPSPDVSVVDLELDAPQVRVGDTLGFSAVLRNDGSTSARVVVDYVVHHRKANGSLTTKVFKLTTTDLAPAAELRLARRHSFKVITTRRYHPGEHAIELQVNGVAGGRVTFDLLPATD